jgi:hypothetical protein
MGEHSKSIEFSCGNCEREIRVAADLAGRRGACPGCRSALRVPTPERRAERRAAPTSDHRPELSPAQRLGVMVGATLLLWVGAWLWPGRISPSTMVWVVLGGPVLGVMTPMALELALERTRIPLWASGLSLAGGALLFVAGLTFAKVAASATGVVASIMGLPLALGAIVFMVGVAGLLSNAVALARLLGADPAPAAR